VFSSLVLADPEVVDRLEDFLAEGPTRTALRISRILLIMLFTAHFMACAWILAARMNGFTDPEESSWISEDKVAVSCGRTSILRCSLSFSLWPREVLPPVLVHF
jgi:hypothetical protein